ncbi:MAG: hypothetical protein IKO80_06380 [Lachnospiraceae bacterium]|nr:hypothetical protein [Lachnospiraceae bacterium]
MTGRLTRIYAVLMLLIGTLLTGFLSVLCLRYQVFVTMDIDEIARIRENPLILLLFWLLTAAVLILLKKPLSRIPEKWLFVILALLYLVFGTALCFFSDLRLRSDQERVFYYANMFDKGDYSGLQPDKYMGWYPYQLGLLTYERLLLRLYSSTVTIYLANLAEVLLISFLQWRIVRILFHGDTLITKYTILLSFAFLPQFFYILFPYGQIPGLCFTYLAVYAMLKRLHGSGIWSILLCAVSIAVAAMLKTNYRIAVIAVCITLFAALLQRKRYREMIAALAGIILLSAAGMPLLTAYYERVSGMRIGGGIPVIAIVAMGLQENEDENNKGWSNEYDLNVYYENDCDTERAAAAGRKELEDRLAVFAADPSYAAAFFGGKVISTWCDPMFESVWVGPLPALDFEIRTSVLRSLYRGEGLYPYLADAMNVLTALLFSGAFLFAGWRLLRGGADTAPEVLYPLLYLTGGFLFHLISETSSQYVYMYVYTLIPLSAAGIAQLAVRTARRDSRRSRDER